MWFRLYGVAWAFMLISIRRREMTWGDIFENDVPDVQTEGRKRWAPSSDERHENQKGNTHSSALPESSSYTQKS
jgi:hypothetical protein